MKRQFLSKIALLLSLAFLSFYSFGQTSLSSLLSKSTLLYNETVYAEFKDTTPIYSVKDREYKFITKA